MKILRCNFQYSVAPKECTTGSREQEVISESRKEGRKRERKEEREGGRKEGGKGGRKEVKYVIPIYFTFNKTSFRITQVDIRESIRPEQVTVLC
jgi:predicted transposase YdaD